MSIEAEKTEAKGGARDTIRVIIHALILALIVRVFLFQPFNIPSGSMIPTLLIGDYLFVSKYSYGYSRYSFPFGLDLFSGRVWAKEPERGDVVVFKLPSDNNTEPSGEERHVPRYRETLPNGVTYPVLDAVPNGFGDNTEIYKVPEGHFFMMGDNRDNSTDSRFLSEVGFVPFENLVGKAQVIFFSMDENSRFFEVWAWPDSVRWSRLLQAVH